MTPQKQAFLHKPDEGIYGDCQRTVIACILDLPRDEVPHFNDASAYELKDMDRRTNEWLASRGLIDIKVPYPGELPLDDLLEQVSRLNPGVHYMLAGLSRTGVDHVVICYGAKIVWDTSLTDAGITGPGSDGMWWIDFIGKLV